MTGTAKHNIPHTMKATSNKEATTNITALEWRVAHVTGEVGT